MRKRTVLFIILLFLCLLCFPRTAVSSARDGLLLWYHSVFPVLFPFLFLSSLLIRIVSPHDMPGLLAAPIMRLFGCSAYGAFVILAGFLCGFPIGAKISADLYAQNKISREEAMFLQGFANNLSPGFILSYLSAEQMGLPDKGGCFLIQILGAAALAGFLSANVRSSVINPGIHKNKSQKYRPQRFRKENTVQTNKPNPEQATLSFSIIDDCINDAMSSALKLCAYILLFSILSGLLTQFVPLSNPAVLLLTASIEVTNGIRLIAESSLSFAAKYISASALAAFGGWSALAQSAGIARMDRELLFHYTKSRVKITLLTILISITVLLISQ
ncbi:MAG: hypothetical protein LIP10_08155 [Clostridiales bacterium]|nr:hypothetical protein [Clostridiales bacterium]